MASPGSVVDKRPLIFVSPPRTGTHTVFSILGLRLDQRHNHLPARAIRQNVGLEAWSQALVFGFVRNPFDRLISFYCYCRESEIAPHIYKDLSFERWIMYGCPTHWASDLVFGMGSPTGRPLYLTEYFLDEDGKLIVSQVLRFEKFDRELRRIIRLSRVGAARRVAINKICRSVHRPQDYRSWFTNRSMIARVREIFSKDLEVFGYDF